MDSIAPALNTIHQQIRTAQTHSGQSHTVTLCAVSKAQSADRIRAAYVAGQTVFGENYLQEALLKQQDLQDCNIEWHFIGPIQSNKTQAIALHFDWVQSVDRLKIAQRLSAQRPTDKTPLNVCLQINISEEASKSGASRQEILTLAMQIKDLPNLKLRGLMAIPAPSQDESVQRDQFRQLRQLFELLNAQGLALDTLSMGMSGDFVAAIAEGATLIRVGTAIFGNRQPS